MQILRPMPEVITIDEKKKLLLYSRIVPKGQNFFITKVFAVSFSLYDDSHLLGKRTK